MTRSVLMHRRGLSSGLLLASDSFNRADSATNLGVTDGAGELDPLTWTQLSTNAGQWGISSNQAYEPGQNNWSTADVETGASDVDITCTVPAAFAAGIAFRLTSIGNFWMAHCDSSGRLKLFHTIASIQGQVGATGPAWANGDVIRVVATGSVITFYQNGVAWLAVTAQTFNQTATRHGLFSSGSASSRWDDWSVRTA